MPELRQNFFSKEWVIIATERAKRPEELATHRPVQPVPAFVESCPFCPGKREQDPAGSDALAIGAGRAVGGAGDPEQICGAVERGSAHAQSDAFAAAH